MFPDNFDIFDFNEEKGNQVLRFFESRKED
jgi:hypothetical protein